MGLLNKHPFPVEAFFDKSVVLGFAVPKEDLVDFIPECLELDTFQDQWAFVAVALVKTQNLRPKGFPKFLGRDFTLVGYRVFVRYRGADGRRLRGLYILRSETDRPMMKRLGNLFTRYQYQTMDIDWQIHDDQSDIRSSTGLKLKICHNSTDVSLPEESPFADWREARRFAGPMPFTFSYFGKTHEVVIIEGLRESWMPRPILVKDWEAPALDELGIKNPILANAFIVENVPYEWKRGRTEQWAP